MPHVQRITTVSSIFLPFAEWLEYLLLVCVFAVVFTISAALKYKGAMEQILEANMNPGQWPELFIIIFQIFHCLATTQYNCSTIVLRVAQESTRYTTGKYSSIAFVWVAIATQKPKSWSHIEQHSKQYDEIVLTEAFTWMVIPWDSIQTQKYHLYSIISSTTGKCCSVAFFRMVTL